MGEEFLSRNRLLQALGSGLLFGSRCCSWGDRRLGQVLQGTTSSLELSWPPEPAKDRHLRHLDKGIKPWEHLEDGVYT